jgi:hypothetical protein
MDTAERNGKSDPVAEISPDGNVLLLVWEIPFLDAFIESLARRNKILRFYNTNYRKKAAQLCNDASDYEIYRAIVMVEESLEEWKWEEWKWLKSLMKSTFQGRSNANTGREESTFLKVLKEVLTRGDLSVLPNDLRKGATDQDILNAIELVGERSDGQE